MSVQWKGKTGTIYAKAESNISLEEVKACLGEEHFVETDPMRTASGIERYWVFDVGEGIALAFQYSDELNNLMIGTNKEGPIHAKLFQRFVTFPTTKIQGVMWE